MNCCEFVANGHMDCKNCCENETEVFDNWKKFMGLSNTEQKKVLMNVFKKTGLMYSTGTKKSYRALHNEYHTYASVRAWVDEAMEEIL